MMKRILKTLLLLGVAKDLGGLRADASENEWMQTLGEASRFDYWRGGWMILLGILTIPVMMISSSALSIQAPLFIPLIEFFFAGGLLNILLAFFTLIGAAVAAKASVRRPVLIALQSAHYGIWLLRWAATTAWMTAQYAALS